MNPEQAGAAADTNANPSGREDEDTAVAEQLPFREGAPHVWSEANEKQLRSALIGACKRMPRNAEAHFHLGLMYMRKYDGEEALRSFHHCKNIYSERVEAYKAQKVVPPPHLTAHIARLRSHSAQAAYIAATSKIERKERGPYLSRLQRDLVHSATLDNTQPDVWNALALLHLTEGGTEGARTLLQTIRRSVPEYLDALNNLGLCQLSLGHAEPAISCFQKVVVCDRSHAEALSNYGIVLLQHRMYDAAIRAFEGAVEGASQGRGLAFAWGGLAVAKAAIGLLAEAEEAACNAERRADPLNKPKFSVLVVSIRARRATAELRRGLSSVPLRRPSAEEQLLRSPAQRAESADAALRSTEDPRPAIDSAVLRLRALAREIKTSATTTTLGAVLRLRHEYSWEESGNRNFGAEAGERLIEALEMDNSNTSAWVQLSLLQMGTGDYATAREFAAQALSRDAHLEAGWNALAVAHQLKDDFPSAAKAYNKAIAAVKRNYKKKRQGPSDKSNAAECLDRSLAEKTRDEATLLDTQDLSQEEADSSPSRSGQESVSSTSDRSPTHSLTGDYPEEPDSILEDLDDAGLNALSAIYNNLGNLKRQEGRSFSEALSAFNTSLKLGGEKAIVYNNLALLYMSVSRFEEANGMLEHALKLGPRLECATSNHLKLQALMRQRDCRSQREDEESNDLEADDAL